MKRRFAATVGALVALAMLAAPGASAAPLSFLQTPDGNVGCAVFKGSKRVPGSARCDIRNKSWPSPPKPRSCDVDYGFGLEIGKRKPARFVCAGDTTLSQGPQLPVGSGVSRGRFTCTVIEIAQPQFPGQAPLPGVLGVRCLNRRTQRGFELSAIAPTFLGSGGVIG